MRNRQHEHALLLRPERDLDLLSLTFREADRRRQRYHRPVQRFADALRGQSGTTGRAVIAIAFAASFGGCMGAPAERAACGGLGFAPCPDRDVPLEPGAMGGPTACTAQIGFEDGRTDGWSTANCCRLALGTPSASSEQSRCGGHALRVPVQMVPDDPFRQEGELTLSLPIERFNGAGTLSLWMYLDGPPLATGAGGYLRAVPGAASGIRIAMAYGQWMELTVELARIFTSDRMDGLPRPRPTSMDIALHLYSGPQPWTGVLYIDEVSWR